MLGLILCGGQSSRMGTDKGLLQLQDQTWATAAVNKLRALQLPAVLSVNKTQLDHYAQSFAYDYLIKDNETMDVRGPLCGLLSVHELYPSEDLFVLACDMPLMEIPVLRQLYNHYKEHPAAAYTYRNDGAAEPLCGIYTAGGLSKIYQLQKKGQLAKHSMKYMLEQIDTVLIDLTAEQKKCFRNFNSHGDLYDLVSF